LTGGVGGGRCRVYCASRRVCQLEGNREPAYSLLILIKNPNDEWTAQRFPHSALLFVAVHLGQRNALSRAAWGIGQDQITSTSKQTQREEDKTRSHDY